MLASRTSQDGCLIVPPAGRRFADSPSSAEKAKTFVGICAFLTMAAAGTYLIQGVL